MTEFRVWAPDAVDVAIEVAGEEAAMVPVGEGWWWFDAGTLEGEVDYRYSVDGAPFAPDPRSRWQPDGATGPSRTVDPGRFPWTDEGWSGFRLAGAVLYELHVGTFSPAGTFDGAVERLDHLVALGVDAVELMPVAQWDGRRGWGYDGVDLYAVHDAYGGPAGLHRFVDACHDRGLGVVLDVVYNHLGPSGNTTGVFGPYYDTRHGTLWGDSLNVDGPGSDGVRSWVIDNACYWLRDFHLDGLRLDAVHAIVDLSATPMLEELSAEIDALADELGRPLWLIAEADLNDPRLLRRRDQHGLGLHSAWADDWHHALHSVLTGEGDGYYVDYGSMADVVAAIEQGWVYTGGHSIHRGRRHGRSPAGLGAEQFVVSLQNHDQIGNRARGERLSHLIDPAQCKVAAALLMTSPFTVLLSRARSGPPARRSATSPITPTRRSDWP